MNIGLLLHVGMGKSNAIGLAILGFNTKGIGLGKERGNNNE